MRLNTAENFTDHVSPEPNTGCWLWTGAMSRSGYGYFMINGQNLRAHRLVLMLRGVVLGEKDHIDHLCRVRCCVNPAHLEVVTQYVNTMRGEGVPAKNARKTHCKRGHELTANNLRRSDLPMRRKCIICSRITSAEYKRKSHKREL